MNRSHWMLISLLILGIGLPVCCAHSQPISSKQKIPAKNKLPLSWARFMQQGGSRYIQFDYDLPSEFRNGRVYFNTEKNQISAFILKKGLYRYPPIQAGSIELNYEYMPLLESRGEMIVLSWDFITNDQHNNDVSVRYPYPNQNVSCLRNVCLLASMLTKVERERILRSQYPIKSLSH